MPALHISLGTYLKFFNMLETACELIDIKISLHTAANNEESGKAEIDSALAKFESICHIEKSIRDYEEKIQLVHEATTLAIIQSPDNEIHIRSVYNLRIEHLQKKLSEKVIFALIHCITLCFRQKNK